MTAKTTNLTRRQAIAEVRAEADFLIEQMTRKANGWDKGTFRDDDTLRAWTINQSIRNSVSNAFYLSAQFAADEATVAPAPEAAPEAPAVAPRFARFASLVARRNLLNGLETRVRPWENQGEWNRRRISLRNKLNGMIKALAEAL